MSWPYHEFQGVEELHHANDLKEQITTEYEEKESNTGTFMDFVFLFCLLVVLAIVLLWIVLQDDGSSMTL